MLKYGVGKTCCKSKEIKEILGSCFSSSLSDFRLMYPDSDIFGWDYLYDNDDLTQLGSFECELTQTEHPLQGFCF